MGRNKSAVQGQEIDFTVAIPKRGRGRPKGSRSTTKPKAPAKSSPGKPSSINNNIYINRVNDSGIDINTLDDINKSVSLDDELTLKELKFIELRLSGEYTIDNAMKLAGYEGYHQNSLWRLARKIVQKYESRAEDHKKTLRAMGYGEIKAVELLIEAATKFKGEQVRLNARVQLCKMLGLQKEDIEDAGGVKIIFEAPDSQGQGQAPPPRPVTVITPALPPGKPLMITK